MWVTRQKTKLQELYREFPRPFWTLTAATFFDRVGGALLYPFIALYFTGRFGVGMTEVGILFALYAVSSFVGQLIGGTFSDRFGRQRWRICSQKKSAPKGTRSQREPNGGEQQIWIRRRWSHLARSTLHALPWRGMLVSLIGMNLFATLGV